MLGFPKRDIENCLVESAVLEAMGDTAGALRSSRAGVARALDHSKSLPNLLLGELNRRAELESTRRALISRTNELVEQTMIDPLSGLGNRRGLDAHGDRLRDDVQHEIAVLLIDIDRFKVVNDSFGHSAGDQLIGQTGTMLQGLCGPGESIFRYGGDEFVVIVEHEDAPDRARDLAEQIRLAFTSAERVAHAITCSIGLAIGPSESIDEIIRAADAAMYEAKSAGRNRVELSRQKQASTAEPR